MTTDCYKCGTEMETQDEGFVHQLCDKCDAEFMVWFNGELKMPTERIEEIG